MKIDAEQIGTLARDALAQEAQLSPKPGLVDAENSGAHSDMDLSLLLLSAETLLPYFTRFAALGCENAGFTPVGRLSSFRVEGIEAERAMFAATRGVNTHRGALFLLGALCYAAGYCAENGLRLLPETVCRTAGRLCAGVTRELGASAGRAYAKYGAAGARGEAEAGFPHALLALAESDRATTCGAGEDEAWLLALLRLIAAIRDTNVLARCGEETARALRRQAGDLADAYPAGGNALAEAIRALDYDCRILRVSPGGAADLLACAMFLRALDQTDAQRPAIAEGSTARNGGTPVNCDKCIYPNTTIMLRLRAPRMI